MNGFKISNQAQPWQNLLVKIDGTLSAIKSAQYITRADQKTRVLSKKTKYVLDNSLSNELNTKFTTQRLRKVAMPTITVAYEHQLNLDYQNAN